MKEIMIHREKEREKNEEFYMSTTKMEDIGVIQRSTNFDSERFFRSSGDVADEALDDP